MLTVHVELDFSVLGERPDDDTVCAAVGQILRASFPRRFSTAEKPALAVPGHLPEPAWTLAIQNARIGMAPPATNGKAPRVGPPGDHMAGVHLEDA